MVKRNSTNEEPNTAPEPDRWYDIKLGSSFQDHHNHSSPKFCTLRCKHALTIKSFLRSVLFQRKFSEVVTKSFFFVFNDVVLEL